MICTALCLCLYAFSCTPQGSWTQTSYHLAALRACSRAWVLPLLSLCPHGNVGLVGEGWVALGDRPSPGQMPLPRPRSICGTAELGSGGHVQEQVMLNTSNCGTHVPEATIHSSPLRCKSGCPCPGAHPPPYPLGSQLQTELLCAPARQPEPAPAASPSTHTALLHHYPWGAGQLCAAEPGGPDEVGRSPGLAQLHLVWRKRLGSG